MSEFTKWDKTERNPDSISFSSLFPDNARFYARKEGWLAALSWVLKEISLDPDVDVVILIEQELKKIENDRDNNNQQKRV